MKQYKSLFDYMYTTLGYSPGGLYRNGRMEFESISDEDLSKLNSGTPFLIKFDKLVEFNTKFVHV